MWALLAAAYGLHSLYRRPTYVFLENGLTASPAMLCCMRTVAYVDAPPPRNNRPRVQRLYVGSKSFAEPVWTGKLIKHNGSFTWKVTCLVMYTAIKHALSL